MPLHLRRLGGISSSRGRMRLHNNSVSSSPRSPGTPHPVSSGGFWLLLYLSVFIDRSMVMVVVVAVMHWPGNFIPLPVAVLFRSGSSGSVSSSRELLYNTTRQQQRPRIIHTLRSVCLFGIVARVRNGMLALFCSSAAARRRRCGDDRVSSFQGLAVIGRRRSLSAADDNASRGARDPAIT